jgi:LysM repeat protein
MLKRALTGSALTIGLLGLGAGAAAAATYEVAPGDTLAQIARDQGVDRWQTLYDLNRDRISDPNRIFPGQTLRLTGDAPADGGSSNAGSGSSASGATTYTVRAGDTLATIGRAHGMSWQSIYERNTSILSSPSLIFPGQVLALSDTATPASTSSSGSSTATTPAPQGTVSMSTWDRLAQCESGGNWSINTGNGFYGGLQFSLSSWRWVGGSGYPHQASKAEQIARAEILLERQGWARAWPACSRQLGLS